MAARSTNPSVGLNAATGGILEGWPHVAQSLQDIFTTRFPDRDRDEWVRLEIESNPLPICTRPQVLRSARRT